MKSLSSFILFFLCLSSQITFGQAKLYGTVKNSINDELPFAKIEILSASNLSSIKKLVTDEYGRFTLENEKEGDYVIVGSAPFYLSDSLKYILKPGKNNISIILADTNTLGAVEVHHRSNFSTRKMRMVEGVIVTNGKKTEHIQIDNNDGNNATNNARELYAKVPGLNIWESDGGGLQLGIGARGLSPSRTAHFNTRQNGYDISADALGYPETYYTPPTEALEAIQLIRGAASLQFGPQFGGMLNFKIKPPSTNKIQYEGYQTIGAYNLYNTFNKISGTLKKRFSYMAYYQYKKGDGWRENSNFEQQNIFAQVKYHFTENIFLSAEYTRMNYLAQQAGGLTDAMFEKDPQQSIRDRNWFKVNWQIAAMHFNYDISTKSKLDIKAFKVVAERTSLGNLEKISRLDDLQERTIIDGDFDNFGAELRFLQRYPIGQKYFGILATGVRYYQGKTINRQGFGSADADPNFDFLNPDDLEGSDYSFPSKNTSAFIENIFKINKKLTISAGIRYEYIYTEADGYYNERVYHPLTHVLIFDTTIYETKSQGRSILLGGLGFSYQKGKSVEFYGNIAQNYRGINFSDIRISNPNQIVDPDIQDEKGFNADLGMRGQRENSIFDISAFFMYYNNKIGVINSKINDYEFVRLRTNVGRAYSTGLELFAEHKFAKVDTSSNYFSVFTNLSAIYAKYGKHDEKALSNKWIELVPPISIKIGLKYTYNKWKFSLLGSYVHQHYSDGTNAESDPNAIAGLIPSYYVVDFNTAFNLNKHFVFKGGINNLTNNKYFTRRATSYPGPGIIPSDGISFYLTVGITI
ncbi:TonB-dependent receptor domain-containing protein [Crocinitomix catalasitica]|uniref:TonB-dependent receptor domain-containing protein n=1 Tax=Crocinitomix catalasitica TaxID=184607 RepID=UPI0004838E76|nr:TonB-dependent receptor [Crocinitomix catalasitica]